MRWLFWSHVLPLANSAFLRYERGQPSATSLLQRDGRQRADSRVALASSAPDLWAQTSAEDLAQGFASGISSKEAADADAARQLPVVTEQEPQELELTRTAGAGWYTAPLQIGGNISQVVVDTASPWLWSYGGDNEEVSEGEDAGQPEPFSISYMSAELRGVVVKKNLALHASSSSPASSMHGQCKAGKATSGDEFWERQYSKSGVQGVFGLACGVADSGAGALAAAGLQTGLTCASAALGAGTAAPAPRFSLQMGATGGKLSFGEPPFDLLRGLVYMPPSTLCGNWRAPLRVTMAAAGGTAGQDTGVSEATLDSAALGIVGLNEKVASLAQALGAKIDVREGRMVFITPCSRAGSLPDVELHLGEGRRQAVVRLSGDDILVPDDKESGDTHHDDQGSENGKRCRLIFSGWDSPQWLLGMPFFRAVRGVVFNPSENSVAIAP